MLLELDVERMMTLATHWGNVPRSLLQYIAQDDQAVEAGYRRDARKAVQKCQDMMDEGILCNLPDDPPTLYYVIRPTKIDTGALDRRFSYVDVPTRTLCRILAEALKGQSGVVKLQFYDTLRRHPKTRQLAGVIFESWFHSFFIERKRLHYRVVRGSGDEVLQCPTTTHLIPVTRDAPMSAAPPYYWIPSETDFQGIHSALVLEKEIVAFQVSLWSDRTSPIGGLECLRRTLPHDVGARPWRVVFVGPDEARIRGVAQSWDGRLCFSTDTTRVAVGWSVVDPVQDDVIYRVCQRVDPSRIFF
jgi:hypothetical protein